MQWVDFLPYFAREISVGISELLSCKLKPCCKGINSERNEFTSKSNTCLFSFREELFLKGDKTIPTKLPLLKVNQFRLKYQITKDKGRCLVNVSEAFIYILPYLHLIFGRLISELYLC